MKICHYYENLSVLFAASSALALSDIPWNGPVGTSLIVILIAFVALIVVINGSFPVLCVNLARNVEEIFC